MQKFSWARAIGSGIAVWLIMFALIAAFVGFGIFASVWMQIVAVLAAGILGYLFAKYTKAISDMQSLGYGLMFVIVGLILDLVVTMQFDKSIFSTWYYWLSYAFILFAPWVEYRMRESPEMTIQA